MRLRTWECTECGAEWRAPSIEPCPECWHPEKDVTEIAEEAS